MVRAVIVLVAVACIACQGQGSGGAGSASGAPAGDGSLADATSGLYTADALPAAGRPDEPDGPGGVRDVADPGRLIAELGAIPAWQAVVDRAQLLGRRGQHGVVFGRVGPALMVLAHTAAPVVTAPGADAGAAGPLRDAGMPPGAARTSDAGILPGAVRTSDAGILPGAGTGQARTLDAGTLPGTGTGQARTLDAGMLPGAGTGQARTSDAGAPAPGAAPVVIPAAPIDAGLIRSPYVWLVDDSEGNGSLGIRIALGDKAHEGDRIAAGGAWQLDAERRWFWKPDAVQPLPPGPASDLKEPQPPVPSHAIASGELPPGARTISVARDGDAAYFQIVGPAPIADGDGWQIADQLGSPVVAVMNLPGERPSYGGQDMRAADERWQLRRGQTYWVRIGKLRKRGIDKPTLINARTAPIRVP